MKNSTLLILVGSVMAMVGTFMACGANDKDDDTGSATPAVTWNDVQPIIAKSCAAAGSSASCHSSSGSNTYNWQSATSETFAKGSADYTAFKNRLEQGDMPPAASTGLNPDNITLTAGDRKTLEAYFQ